MTGFTFETVIANQFLSSLSKSLQALCHGCMDFNAGIEIQGYIHVDVDKEKTFDYVLNEKLQRTTNESMSFISNSFFAKKDHQTQVPNGPLSTSPELQESLHVSSSLKTSSNLSQTDRSLTPQNALRKGNHNHKLKYNINNQKEPQNINRKKKTETGSKFGSPHLTTHH